MGNCCAAKPSHPNIDKSKMPLRPPMTSDSHEESKTAASTRPGSAKQIEDAEDKKKGKDADEEASAPLVRVSNLNQNEQMQPRDLPVSAVNSVQSSTLPGDGSSINPVNRTHLGTPELNLAKAA